MNALHAPDQGEDRRIDARELCGVVELVGGNEFICVAEAHGSARSDQRDGRGRPSKWRRHYFVRRYPYREMTS